MEKFSIKPGTILISKPSLSVDIFSRSIVLITDYSEFGAVGFVLNKATDYKTDDLIKNFPFDITVFEGGPVEQDNLFYIHSLKNIPNAIAVTNHLFWGGNLQEINHQINFLSLKNFNQIKFFIGYSGWSSGQLEEEIKNNFWAVVNDYSFNPIDIQEVEDWKKQMTNLGGENLLWANMPENPLLN